MTARHHQALALSLLVTAVVAAAACGASGRKPTPTGQGRLAVSLVDAPAPQATSVVVNITRVTAHGDAFGWVDVTPPSISPATPLAVDLLALQAPATPIDLGLANLPAGRVTQLRLYVTRDGNYVVPAGGTARVPLKVPSGTQSGIKVRGPWTLDACAQLSIVLDFDAKKSIWYHPAQQGAEWILRPVIRTRGATSEPVGCGEGCSATNPCPEGQACQPDGTCQSPGPGPDGAPCTQPSDCLSGICDATQHCAPGGAYQPCETDTDCVSGTCDEGTCTVPGGAAGAGMSCAVDADCLSNACVMDMCEPGGQGAACRATSDCQDGMTCTLGTCGMP